MGKNNNDLNKFIGDFLFKAPEKSVDGSIKTPRYETGIVMFDMLLNGGLPKGRAVALSAEWGVGKTTLLIQACGKVIERYGKKVYYIDAEGGATYELFYDMGYADILYHPETNPDGKFYLLSVQTIQDISRIITKVVKDPDTAIIVIDSDTQVTDRNTLEDELLGTGKNDIGSNARMWSRVSRNLNAVISESEVSLILVHQARLDLSGFIPKVVASGGNAMKHLVSVEIWGKRKAWIGKDFSYVKDRKEAIGALVKLTTEKNRLTRPFAVVEIPIIFGRGVNSMWAYRQWLEEHTTSDQTTGEVVNVLHKGGAGYYTLTLPSGVYKCRGDAEVWKLVDEHWGEVVNYVESNGGFELKIRDEDDEEF
jgi:RecA/RadA recombinase